MKHLLLVVAFVLSVFALQAQSAKTTLAIFPNPATEYIAVAEHNESLHKVVVFSIIGRRVKEFEYSKDEHFYIGDLNKGMYLVQLVDYNNRVVNTQKIEKR